MKTDIHTGSVVAVFEPIATGTSRPAAWATVYLLLSGVCGLIELGVLLIAARGDDVLRIPLYMAAYQLGALLSHPVKLPRIAYPFAGAVACVSALAARESALLMTIAIAGLSIVLQRVRDHAGHHCRVSTFWKRTARVTGFVVAPWLHPLGLALLCLPMLVGCALVPASTASRRNGWPRMDILGVTMAIHQLHYFMYSSFLPYVFVRMQGIHMAYSGLAFALGWTSYCYAPKLLSRWRREIVLVAGHVLVAVSIGAMLFGIESASVVLISWFVSGFGGGTVFCLRDLERERGPAQEGHLDAWENIGHVLGAGLAIGIVAASGGIASAFVSAAAAALATACLGVAMWFGLGRPDRTALDP